MDFGGGVAREAVLKPQNRRRCREVPVVAAFLSGCCFGGEENLHRKADKAHSSCTSRIFPEYNLYPSMLMETAAKLSDRLHRRYWRPCLPISGPWVDIKPISRIGVVEVDASSAMICAVPGEQHASCSFQKRGMPPRRLIAGKRCRRRRKKLFPW